MDTLLLPSTLLSSLLLVLLFHAARPTLSDVETARDSRDFAEELKALYSRVNPSKLGDVPYLLLKNKGKEAQLIAAVEQKYSGRPCTLDEINNLAECIALSCDDTSTCLALQENLCIADIVEGRNKSASQFVAEACGNDSPHAESTAIKDELCGTSQMEQLYLCIDTRCADETCGFVEHKLENCTVADTESMHHKATSLYRGFVDREHDFVAAPLRATLVLSRLCNYCGSNIVDAIAKCLSSSCASCDEPTLIRLATQKCSVPGHPPPRDLLAACLVWSDGLATKRPISNQNSVPSSWPESPEEPIDGFLHLKGHQGDEF